MFGGTLQDIEGVLSYDGEGVCLLEEVNQTEINYLSGVSSNVQTQLDGKLNSTISSNINMNNYDLDNVGDINAISNIEFNRLLGIRDNIQGQLDAKLDNSGDVANGDYTFNGSVAFSEDVDIGGNSLNNVEEIIQTEGNFPYNYIIYKDGTSTKVKNDFGEIIFSGSDSNSVFDDLMSYLEIIGGGSVLIKNGEYNVTINIPDNVQITGEGINTILYAPAGTYSHMIYIHSNSTLQNLQLNGKYNSVQAIYVFASADTTISNFKIRNLYIKGLGSAISVNGADTSNLSIIENGLIEGNTVIDCVQFGGVESNTVSNYNGTKNIIFKNNYVYNMTGAEFFDYNHATNVYLIDNIFINPNSSHLSDEAIDMNGDNPGSIVRGNTIIGCFHQGIRLPKENAIIEGNYVEFIPCEEEVGGSPLIAVWNGGILLNHTPSYHTITNNILVGGSEGILVGGGSHNAISNNIIKNCSVGIRVYEDTYKGADKKSSYNSIIGNNIYNIEEEGILISDSLYNTISSNVVTDSGYGIIESSSSDYNSIIGNIVNNTGLNFDVVGENTNFYNKNEIQNLESIEIIQKDNSSSAYGLDVQSYTNGAYISQFSTLGGADNYFEYNYPTIEVKRESSSRGANIKIGNNNGGFYIYADNNDFQLFDSNQSSIAHYNSNDWDFNLKSLSNIDKLSIDQNDVDIAEEGLLVESSTVGIEIVQSATLNGTSNYFEPNVPSMSILRGSSSRGASVKIGNSVGGQYIYGTYNSLVFCDENANGILTHTDGWDFMNQEVENIAELEVDGISGDGTGKAVCIKSDGNLGTCSSAINSTGECSCS